MVAFDSSGNLRTELFEPEALDVIIGATQFAVAPQTRSLKCKPGHLLLALCKTLAQSEAYRDALYAGLSDGIGVEEIPSILETYLHDSEREQSFEGKREEFHPNVLRALDGCDRIENELGDTVWEAAGAIGIIPLWVAVLTNPSPEDREGVGPALDFERSAKAFVALLTTPGEAVEVPPLYSQEGALQLELFDDAAVATLEGTREKAGQLGYDKVRPVHLFLALLARPDGLTEEIVRLQAKPGVGPAKVIEVIDRAINLGPGTAPKQLELNQYCLSDRIQAILQAALVLAVKNGADTVSERFLLKAVLENDREGVTGRCLESPEIELNFSVLLRALDRRIRDFKLGKAREEIAPFLLPRNLVKSEDLTYLARMGQVRPSVGQDELIEQVLRGLHKRQNNNILITGQPGVGKTELVRELARRIAAGEVGFLKRKKVVWVDCEGIAAAESRDQFQAIIAAVKGRNDVVLCLDHFEHVVRYAGISESHNRTAIKVALRNRDIHVIGIIGDQEFTELLGNDHSLLEMFNRVRVEEVKVEEAIPIVADAFVPELQRLYGIEIDPAAVARAVRASREFIMSERLPVKAIKVLRDGCEQVSYDKETGRDRPFVVTINDIVRAISQRTGIDEETIAATGASVDFKQVLAQSVVGQEEAVRAVSMRLDRIKRGATKPGKPAGVFLFAGLTGTGKTELAKAIAKVYSASGNMSVYPMQNFQESHSISGVIGVPPGYVGYEHGGRLINDLNSDPYKVVLLDEAEKAHRDVWQGMLSLFDEAWIEDRRNVRAYGNRAIFILTSNAGAETISKMLREGRPLEDIKEAVRNLLLEVKGKDGQNVFSPEFLARFTDIVIFNPLSLEAMQAITNIQARSIVKEWRDKRNKQLVFDDDVLQHVATLAYEQNEAHGGTLGGRFASKLVEDLAETPALNLIGSEAYLDAEVIRVSLEPGPKVAARIEKAVAVAPSVALDRAQERLREVPPVDAGQILGPLREHVEAAVAQWGARVATAIPSDMIEDVKRKTSVALETVQQKLGEVNQTLAEERDKLLQVLQQASPNRL